jgi:iron(III) transport system substrate-binding protein
MLRVSGATTALLLSFMLIAGVPLAQPKADDLPKATLQLLQQLNEDPAILSGLDKELAVPDAWIEGARKEGTFKLAGTWSGKAYKDLVKPFAERYPFIKLQYREAATHENRVNSTLIAFQAGQYISDVIEGISGGFNEFKKVDALADLSDMPGWNNIPDGIKYPDGSWIGFRMRYWCVSYNTSLVNKADLPATWDGFVDNPRWVGSKIGLGNRPNLWLLNLWGAKGEDWAKQYATKLFKQDKPQLRKEGLDALVSLTVSGEFQVAFPTGADRAVQYVEKKAPIGWYCPEPVPAATTGILVLKGNPHINASKLFVNWLVSKEGQIAMYAVDKIPPAHKDLQKPEFVPFADEVVGKKIAFQDFHLVDDVLPDVMNFWNPLWGSMNR